MELNFLDSLKITTTKIKEYVDGKLFVSYDSTQELTDDQQEQARTNIGAISSSDIPEWALAPTKPIYTANEVGALPDDTTIPSLDGYATEEHVSEVVGNLPIVVADDGYTDLIGLRQATSINTVKEDNTITITTTLEGGEISISTITLDDDGVPTSVVTDGVECILTWDGFDVLYTDVSEVGA